MQVISCDICKKKIENPIPDRTFYYIGGNGICDPCKDSLDAQIKPQIRGKEPFSYDWYNKLLSDAIGKGSQKGRI